MNCEMCSGARVVRDGQHARVFLTRGEYKMPHAAVEVGALATLQPKRGVVLSVDLDAPLST